MNLTTSFTDETAQRDHQDVFATKIVLVDRGECSFVTKVRNGERAGASLVVVIDDRFENVTNVIMGDDGTGAGIRIPSMLIGKDSGQILKDFASVTDGATLSAEFNLQHPDDKVEMELWYSSDNTLALDFIKEFDKYVHELQDYIDFVPRFVTWACPMCTDEFKQEECYGDGQYCAPNHAKSFTNNILGRDILMEDLREHCLHSSLKAQGKEAVWWDYMKYVHQECFGFVSEECSKNGHKQIGRRWEDTVACTHSTFGAETFTYMSGNNIMHNNAQHWQEYGTLYWPSVTINKSTFRGDITPENILEALCAGLQHKAPTCIEFYKEENIPFEVPFIENNVTAELLVFVVVLLVAVNIGLIIAYRKCAKKELEADIGYQVSSAVSQYIALSQQNNNRTNTNTSIEMS